MIYNCTECEKAVNGLGRIKRINGHWLCFQCYKERRLKRRKELHDQLKREGVIGLNPHEKHEICLKRLKEHPKELKVRGAKKRITGNGKRISTLGMYLTQVEKQVLFKKYIKQGYDNMEAKKKVENISREMSDLVKNLRSKNKSQKEINIVFKEEFAKLLEW